MSGISTSIQLNDMISGPLMHITSAMNMCISEFEQMQAVSNQSFSNSNFNNVKVELDSANRELDEMIQNINQNSNAQEKFNQSIKEGTSSASGLKNVIGSVGTLLGAYIGLSFLKEQSTSAIEFASDLNEVQNVVDTTFGDASSQVSAWSQTALDAYGLNELSAKRYAGTMGAMLKSSGLAGDSVVNMSESITGLAGDMASFFNLDTDAAFDKIRSGISGETEPLKQLGINMSVANLEAYALSQGIKTAYSDMNQASQTLLRYNYLMSVTGDAQGDFARTSDSFANQTRLLSENWRQFTGNLASNAIPTLTNIVSEMNEFVLNTQTYIPIIVGVFGGLWNVLISIFDIIQNIAVSFVNSWSTMEPILFGVIAALVVYNATMGIAWLTTLQSIVAKTAHAIATIEETIAIYSMIVAQNGLNAALAACPITWIIIMIIGLITAFYAAIAAVNHFTNTSTSATGIIMGVFAVLVSYIWNTVVGIINAIIAMGVELYNLIATFANFFANVFNNPVGAILKLFSGMFDFILGIVQASAKLIDTVLRSNLAGAVEGFRNDFAAEVNDIVGEQSIVLEKKNAADYQFNGADYNNSWSAGYKVGEGIANKVENFNPASLFDFNILDQADNASNQIPTNIQNTADNTKSIKDSVELTGEDLKYLRDAAETEIVNRFTTAEIKVEMGGITNNVNSKEDLDGIGEYLRNKIEEEMQVAAEGVH